MLRGLFYCVVCGRKMQGQYSHGRPYYRCAYPREYALAEHVKHPLNVYVQERDVLPALDDWLATLFAPHRIDDTVRALAACQHTTQPTAATDVPDDESDALLAACEAKLAKYRAALEAGVDPETVGAWITAVKSERAAIAARSVRARTAARPDQLLSEDQIAEILRALGDIRAVIHAADPADKARIYRGLGLQLTYAPGPRVVRAQVTLDPNNRGVMDCVRGGT